MALSSIPTTAKKKWKERKRKATDFCSLIWYPDTALSVYQI
jgi:hypothetical protein